MRIITLLLSAILLAQPVLSQPPTKAQMQEQMMNVKKSAQKQIADLEKDVVTAKANNENPETLKEKEDQLAMMKKMLGVIDKAGSQSTRPKTLPATKTVIPKYISPIVRISLKQAVVTPTEAQAKDQLLWYNGKKIDDSTLVTTRGMVVRYSRQRNMVIFQPDEKKDTTAYISLAKTLVKTEKFKNDFAVEMNGIENSFFMFPEILKSYEEFDIMRDRFYDIARNTIALPPPLPDRGLEALHEQLKEMMSSLPALSITPPPERPNDLCSCDPKERKDYENALRDWYEAFWQDEENLLEIFRRMYIHMTNYRSGNGGPRVPIPDFLENIAKAYNLVIERKSQKLFELYRMYEAGNISLEDGLVLATLSFEKLLLNYQAKDIETETIKKVGYQRIDRIKNTLLNDNVFNKYIKDQKAIRNYNVVFNYSLYISHEANRTLLNPSYETPENFSKLWHDGLKKYNRFTLTVNMDFEFHFVDKEDKTIMSADGILESGNMIVSLGRTMGCKWQLFRTDMNHGDKSGKEDLIPIKIRKGTKIFYPPNRPPVIIPYSGPDSIYMVFPSIRLSFCKSGGQIKDSAMMDIMRYSDAGLNAHKNDDYSIKYSTDMDMYANKMFLGIKETENKASDLADIAGNMINIQGITQLPPSTGSPSLDQLMMDYIMNQQKIKLQSDLSQTTHTGKTVIPFVAANGDPVLVSGQPYSTVDPNDKDKLIGAKLIKSLVTLKVIHTPLP